jgi:hypothetical protein
MQGLPLRQGIRRVVTRGAVSPDDPLDYLLDKVAETVREAASSANSELGPYLRPMQNYLTALAGNAGTEPARDFALGVLTKRVRQEEDGWPDQPGDPRGKRTAHSARDRQQPPVPAGAQAPS